MENICEEYNLDEEKTKQLLKIVGKYGDYFIITTLLLKNAKLLTKKGKEELEKRKWELEVERNNKIIEGIKRINEREEARKRNPSIRPKVSYLEYFMALKDLREEEDEQEQEKSK